MASVAVVFFIAFFSWRIFQPPLSVRSSDGVVEVDVRRLGEYNSSLGEIEVVDIAAGRVVWRAVAGDDAIEIFTFVIRSGTNPVDLGLRRQDAFVRIDLPVDGEAVNFAADHAFEIRISSKSNLPFGVALSSTTSFTLATKEQ